MKHRFTTRRTKRRDSGYALLLMMFFLALLVISMAAVAPTVLSSVQRERETEMVWRGRQYTRGIRMYYLKMKRFPTSLDDLTQPKMGIRFMRQAYKDPMNQVDGSWRLIYVGPNGQLIGSLSDRPVMVGGMGVSAGTPGTGALGSSGNGLTNTSAGGFGSSTLGGSSFGSSGSSSFGSSSFGASSFGSSSFGSGQAGATTLNGPNGTGMAGNNPGTGATGANGTESTDDPLQPHSLAGSMDASNTIGGNIIGVGSKVNKKSFLIYEHAKNYRQFEFIWDPSKDTTVGRASAGIGTPIQNSTGMTPAGSSSTPNSPFSSSPNPGQNINQPQAPAQGPSTPGGIGSEPSPTPLQAPNQ